MTPAASLGLPLGRPAMIELRRVQVPLVAPIAAAHGVERVRNSIVVRAIGDDGAEGWGECVALTLPTYTPEWQQGAWTLLCELLAPAAVAGADPGVQGHPMAAAAIESALVDMQLRRDGRSLASALGATATRVPSRAVLGIIPGEDQLITEVATRLDQGHRSVKLKIHPGWDMRPLAAVREAWPDLDLAADANGSYTLHEHSELLVRLDGLRLSYVEQPLAARDLVGHAELRRRIATPVALDETATDLGAVEAALALGAVDLVNVKPARLGGLGPCIGLHHLVLEGGISAFCGGMYELGLGRAVAVAVAAMPGFEAPADLGPSRAYVTDDITAPWEMARDGSLAVPSGPGIGRAPEPARLDEVTVDRCVVGTA